LAFRKSPEEAGLDQFSQGCPFPDGNLPGGLKQRTGYLCRGLHMGNHLKWPRCNATWARGWRSGCLDDFLINFAKNSTVHYSAPGFEHMRGGPLYFKEDFMKKMFVLVILMALVSATLHAQSAKSTVQVSSLDLVSATADNGGWQTILGNANPFAANALTMRTAQQKDLIFTAALECGIYTRTLTRSSGGSKDTSKAEARVQIRIKVDPGTAQERTADPGIVTFCNRYQELSATLQGILELACSDADGDGQLDTCDLNVVSPEEIELILKTLNANAFVFALDDLGSGIHNVIVEARITSANEFQLGEAGAWALIGKGGISVEEVRLIKGSIIDIGQ
jgi:hypothetical protein